MFFPEETPAPPLPRVNETWRMARDKTGPGIKEHIANPSDVAFVDDEYFVVADSEGHGLPMYEVNGRHLSVVAKGKVWPNCVAVTRDGKMVCTDRQSKRTKIYDITGVCVRELGQDLWDGEFEVEQRPHGVVVNSKGQIIVTDTSLHKVKIYSDDGALLHEFGGKGHRVGQLLCPFYVAVDNMDNIVVSDNMNYSIKKFDVNGNYIMRIGSGQDWGQRSFQSPYGVAVDRYGNILVADHEAKCIKMYSEEGEFMGDIITKKDCVNPCGLAVNKKGSLVFTENNTDHANLKSYKLIYDTVLMY